MQNYLRLMRILLEHTVLESFIEHDLLFLRHFHLIFRAEFWGMDVNTENALIVLQPLDNKSI